MVFIIFQLFSFMYSFVSEQLRVFI